MNESAQLFMGAQVLPLTMKLIPVLMTMGALMGSVCAQEEERKRERPGGGRGGQGQSGGLVGALDKNGDGQLQQAEIDMAVAVLRKLDKDGDGTVSREELASLQQGRRPGSGPGQGGQGRRLPSLDQLDKDGDGKISKDEAPERMKSRFEQMDGNGDGFLDKAEIEEVMKRLRERMREGGESRPNQGGGRKREEDPSGGEKPKRPPSAK